MHPNALKTIADQITALTQGLDRELTLDDQLANDPKLRTVTETLSATPPWSTRATRADARALVLQLARGVATGLNRADLEREITAAETQLNASPPRLLVTPVHGLLVTPPLRMAPVTFQYLDDPAITALVNAQFGVPSPGTPHLQQVLRNDVLRTLRQLRNATVSLYEASGTDARLRRDAITATRTALHLLRGLTMLTHDFPQDVDLSASGDERLGEHISLMLEARGMSVSQRPLDHVEIDELRLEAVSPASFEGLVLAQLPALLAQDRNSLNNWQRTLLRCFEWLGTAQTQQDPEGAFLNLAVVLEILFTDQNAVAETVADAMAFLTEQTVETRLARRKQVKALYSLRSSIMHGRTSSTVAWEKVHELRFLLRGALAAILPHAAHWTDRTELTDHINRLKYA